MEKEDTVISGPPIPTELNDPTADVALISSDNFLLLVHKYELQFASEFFRNLFSDAKGLELDNCGRTVIRLDDSDLECHRVLHKFFRLLRYPSVDNATCIYTGEHLAKLWLVTEKFACSVVQTTLKSMCKMTYTFPTCDASLFNPYAMIFAIAAHTEDEELCEELLERTAKIHNIQVPLTEFVLPDSEIDRGDDPIDTVRYCNPLDIALFDPSLVAMMPTAYFWALIRSRSGWTTSTGKLFRCYLRDRLGK